MKLNDKVTNKTSEEITDSLVEILESIKWKENLCLKTLI